MMTSFSRILQAVMIGLLLLAGEQIASARGAAAATGLGVFCAGGVMVMMTVDETGAPAPAAHLCPDAIFGDVPLDFTLQTPPMRALVIEAAPALRGMRAGQVPQNVRQRGPPKIS